MRKPMHSPLEKQRNYATEMVQAGFFRIHLETEWLQSSSVGKENLLFKLDKRI